MNESDLNFLSLIASTEETGRLIQGIYAITNLETGRRYIGSAVNVQKRYSEHRRHLRRGSHHNPPLQRAWVKYGEANFRLTVVEKVERKENLCEVEQSYLDRERGLYNVAPFADRPTRQGMPHSAETKAKIGAANSIALKGKKIPPDVTAKRVAKVLGQKRSAETRARMREAQRGYIPHSAIQKSAALRCGKALSQVHRERISASMKGLERTEAHRTNMSLSQRGKKKSPSAVAAMRAARWTCRRED